MSDSVQPHRWQPTRLLHPRDSPGKNTGVGCHFLLQCMKVKSESEVAQSCPTLCDPMDCSLPGSSLRGIFPGKSTGVGCHRLLLTLRSTKFTLSFLKHSFLIFLILFLFTLCWGRGTYEYSHTKGDSLFQNSTVGLITHLSFSDTRAGE